MSNTHWHPGKRCCVYPFMKKSIKILVENPVCHKSQCKWPECRNVTDVSQVTPRPNRSKWAYWAFPMEHYCGDVIRNIRSRRFPYASINRYVTSHAQLTHISLLYGLDEKLCLQPPASNDRNLILELCMFSMPQQFYEFTLV